MKCKKADIECDCEICKMMDESVKISLKSSADQIVREVIKDNPKLCAEYMTNLRRKNDK